MNDRKAAEEVYSSSFDPNWSHAVAADYYDLLRRFGKYRSIRRNLQDKVRTGAKDLDTVGRLFSIYAFEGNNVQASRALRDMEARRAGMSAASTDQQNANPIVTAASWTSAELQSVGAMFASIGAYDQASRYYYTLYLTGGLASGSQSREDALYHLFQVMLDSAGAPTRLASGDLSFYRDAATMDEHPGVMNGVLSLILSGTDLPGEFRTEESAANGYFNRAFAYRIFTAFKQEYPQSPRLGDMYLGVINVFSSLGEYRLAVDAGKEFQQRFPNSPQYTDVSLRIADCYVALKDRTNERAVLAALLERSARLNPPGMPLIPVASKRWRYGITPQIDQVIDKIRYDAEAYSDTYDPTEGGNADEEPEQTEGDVTSESSSGDTEDEEASQPPASPETPDKPKTTTYSDVLERYVASLAADDKKTETVAFFWGQIRLHPNEEGLYERFLRWLGQAELVNEQLKAYNSAIKQFPSNTWYHRLARWYVRQKRGKELSRYSQQLIGVFDEDEITQYLLRFAGYGNTAAGDGMDWDQRLAFDLYSYAHKRFPENLFFVRGMLSYLEQNDLPGWEKLSIQYYFADRSIREPYLAWLSQNRQLRDKYAQAVAHAGSPGTQGTTPGSMTPSRPNTAGAAGSVEAVPVLRAANAAPVALTTYRIFAADSAAWLSHYDKAVDVYRDLVTNYPGEPQYALRLADLARSFGQQDPGFYDESAQVLNHMAEIYPSDHSYRIKAGEAYAERGEFQLAGQQWDQLVQLEPGERKTYLEVATVFWDYYQYDQAIRVLKDLRAKSDDPTIYAYRLGAVYEGKGDIDSAIDEYVKVLPEPGSGRDTVARRLSQLSKRKGLSDKIATAYNKARAQHPDDWQLLIGYCLYLVDREETGPAIAILRTEMEKSHDIDFLETMRSLFQAILRPEDQQLALTRLAAVARDERESMMYNLQLASFLEQNHQGDAAIKIIDKLVASYPTNVGVVEESAEFYWRAGLHDKAVDLYKRTLAASRGINRRRFTLELAQHQTDAGHAADGEATLRVYYNDNHLDMGVFAALTRTLGVEHKQDDLAALYKQSLKDVRQSGLTGDDARNRVAQLRMGMITTLTGLGQYQDALDQYIEVINTFPEDESGLNAAIEYADKHNLTPRLVSYYERLAKDSYKNYRWELVLGRIYESQENLAGSAEQYRLAIVNEPQRADLRFSLASTLTRLRRYDEAIATLRDGWVYAGHDPQWLIEIARIQVLQGKRDDAVKTMQQVLAAKKSAQSHLAVAAQLAAWGLNKEAAAVYDQVFTSLPKTLKDEGAAPSDVAGYVRVLVRTTPVAAVFQKMEQTRATFAAIAENSQDVDKYQATSIVGAIDESMRSDFGQGVVDYASPAETADLATAIRTATTPLAAYSDKEELVRYLGIARAAGLADEEEHIHVQIKDAAFKARTKPEDQTFYAELRDLLAFYNRRLAFSRAAEVLAAEYRRDQFKDRFDYNNEIATEYRLAGDHAKELDSLRRAYANESGSGIAAGGDWVTRYFELLYSSGSKYELATLASTSNPHQLQLINFLIDKGEKDLARSAIQSARQSQAWTASRDAEVGLFMKDFSPETENFFKAALDPKSIGDMLSRKVDPAKTLVGDDWGIAARDYGYWLGLQPNRRAEARRFLEGEVERHPSSAAPQLELAGFYLAAKDPGSAAQHTALAEELAPKDKNVVVMRGNVALARGDRQGALDAWGALIFTKGSNVDDARRYLKLTASHGLLLEGLPHLRDFVTSLTNQGIGDNAGLYVEAVKPLLRDIAVACQNDPALAGPEVSFFQTIVESIRLDVSIPTMVVEDNLLPEASLGFFYRTVHQRLTDSAAETVGTEEYETGYNNGLETVYPARDLSEWRRRLLDYLIRIGSYSEARSLVATIEKEQTSLQLTLKARNPGDDSSADAFVDHYDWLPLASALIELRGGGDPAVAVSKLRDYCGLKEAPGINAGGEDSGPVNHLNPHCLKAYALLVAEHKNTEADALLYDAYGEVARSRQADDASLAGLAEIEGRRGQADEAVKLLQRLVERSTDNLTALRLAAETAAKIGRYSDAIDFRQQIALANPSDSTNALELARVISATGKNADAVDQLAALIAQRITPNTVRAQAAEVIGDIVRADKSQASRTASLLDQRAAGGDAGAAMARAAVAEAMGNAADERTALGRINTGSLAAIARLKLGMLSLSAGDDGAALTSLEQAVYIDPDGTMTGAIQFKVPDPRIALIELYTKSGRDLAAVQLAANQAPVQPSSGQGSHPRNSVVSAAVVKALNGGSDQNQNQEASVVFEPPFEPRPMATGLRTIAELTDVAASQTHDDLLAALVDATSHLGEYDKAIVIDRIRVVDAQSPDKKTTIEKALSQMLAEDKARRAHTASLLRVDTSNTSGDLYASRASEE
ncbi:MAG TPA: tetratricopeptide repeat protein, partial [Blastocatellia bacterium]